MSIPSTGLGQDEKKVARRRGRPRAPPPEPLPFAHRLTASVAETVTATGLSKSLLYQHMKDGKLAFRMHGARRLVIVASVLKLLGIEQDDA